MRILLMIIILMNEELCQGLTEYEKAKIAYL